MRDAPGEAQPTPTTERMKTLFILILTIALASAAEKIGRLETSDGKVFESATVTKVEPHAITVMHSGGMAKIPLERLPRRDAKEVRIRPGCRTDLQ